MAGVEGAVASHSLPFLHKDTLRSLILMFREVARILCGANLNRKGEMCFFKSGYVLNGIIPVFVDHIREGYFRPSESSARKHLQPVYGKIQIDLSLKGCPEQVRSGLW